MACYRLSVKNGRKGNAATHSRYITREGNRSSSDNEGDLIAEGHGNLPDWANEDPVEFWRQADRHERVNGAVYREYELNLLGELTHEQNKDLLTEFVSAEIGDKPYQFAIHEPIAALGEVPHLHAHVMFSDREPDGVARSPEQHFRRYNAAHPERGGCRKDSGGKNRNAMKARLESVREHWSQMQNALLEKYGHVERVDHRSNAARGIARVPERYLGQARIRNMSNEDKAQYVASRAG